MRRNYVSALLLTILWATLTGIAFAQTIGAGGNLPAGSSAEYYQRLIVEITGNWQQYGELFTTLQSQWFWKIFLAILVAIPGAFLLHYLVIGAKHFDHDGEKVFFFPLFIRVVHFFAALTFSIILITGLTIILGKFLGGGSVVRFARHIHTYTAPVFLLPGFLMLVFWAKDMFPQFHDLKWFLLFGGYLSKNKKPVPAGKFNGGQKMYFWIVTAGGGVMAYTGYFIWRLSGDVETIRLFAIIHNFLAMAMVAFYLTHVYMSVFAIAGSLESMKTGYKPKEEVDIMHSRYNYRA